MLEKITEAAKKLIALDVERETLQALEANAEILIEKNQEQMFASIDRYGEPLGFYRSIEYANLKGRDDVDLKLTGAFYEGMFLAAEKFPVLFDSKDEKTADLVEKYGEEIFGLTRGNIKKVADDVVIPVLQKKIRAAF